MKQNALYADVPFSMKLNQHKDINLAINNDAIKQSILNILYCGKNTRYLKPDFGCNLLKFLFEDFSEETAYSIGNEIKSKLELYEPRIIVNKINININEKSSAYEIELIYTIRETQTMGNINFSLQHI